jgi:hypothetical protein
LVAATGRETFPKALLPLTEALQKGKPPSSVLPKIVPLTRSPDAETAEAAKLLVETITEGGRKVLQEAEPLVKSDPVAAFLKLERLPAVFKDTAVAARANDLLVKLRPDKAVQIELRARTALAAVKKVDSELSSRAGSFDPTQEAFRKKNALLLTQLQEAVVQMKKSWPKAWATEEALRIGEKYGLAVR